MQLLSPLPLYSFAFRQSSAIRFAIRAGASAVLSSVPWPIGDVMPSATVRRARSLAPSESSNSFCAFSSVACLSRMCRSMASRSYVSPSDAV